MVRQLIAVGRFILKCVYTGSKVYGTMARQLIACLLGLAAIDASKLYRPDSLSGMIAYEKQSVAERHTKLEAKHEAALRKRTLQRARETALAHAKQAALLRAEQAIIKAAVLTPTTLPTYSPAFDKDNERYKRPDEIEKPTHVPTNAPTYVPTAIQTANPTSAPTLGKGQGHNTVVGRGAAGALCGGKARGLRWYAPSAARRGGEMCADVDTSHCGFKLHPQYVCTLSSDGHHDSLFVKKTLWRMTLRWALTSTSPTSFTLCVLPTPMRITGVPNTTAHTQHQQHQQHDTAPQEVYDRMTLQLVSKFYKWGVSWVGDTSRRSGMSIPTMTGWTDHTDPKTGRRTGFVQCKLDTTPCKFGRGGGEGGGKGGAYTGVQYYVSILGSHLQGTSRGITSAGSVSAGSTSGSATMDGALVPTVDGLKHHDASASASASTGSATRGLPAMAVNGMHVVYMPTNTSFQVLLRPAHGWVDAAQVGVLGWADRCSTHVVVPRQQGLC
jgi:hypothetical protein